MALRAGRRRCWPAAWPAVPARLGYYTQAAQGQIALLADSRPIDEVIADPGTTPQLKTRLATARQIRAYAVAQPGAAGQ